MKSSKICLDPVGQPWGPRELPGPQGSSVLVGWAGAANPMGRVGFGLQWSHVVGPWGAENPLLKEYMEYIMIHHVS